jgi:hypothetical protein
VKNNLVIFLLLASFNLFAQTNWNVKQDTVFYGHNKGGEIDTFDIHLLPTISSLPMGSFGIGMQDIPSLSYFTNDPYLRNSSIYREGNSLVNTNLPHLGFFYSFGSKGTQVLKVDYQQAPDTNHLINVNVSRFSSLGIAARNGFTDARVDASHRFTGQRYYSQSKVYYATTSADLNGGVSDTATLDLFGYDFTPVNKNQASVIQKNANVSFLQKFNFLGDSLLKKFGLYSNHSFDLQNREYLEVDSISQLYPFTYIDSFSTRDQYQQNIFENDLGIFIHSKSFSVSGAISQKLFAFQNLGDRNSLSEVNLKSNVDINLNKFHFNSSSKFNLVNGQNYLHFKNNLGYVNNKHSLLVGVNYENSIPDLLYRYYNSNNQTVSALPLEKSTQTTLNLKHNFSIRDKVKFTTRFTYYKAENLLHWSNYNWKYGRQINAISVNSKIHINFNQLKLMPEATYTEGIEYVPEWRIGGRIAWTKKVFEAKKMELLFAVDQFYISEYSLLNYNPTFDNYFFPDVNLASGLNYQLSATFGFKIEEFRFFVRAENIQSLFTDIKVQMVRDYYRSPLMLRFGLTWDFFN